jgi:hypothetical protein
MENEKNRMIEQVLGSFDGIKKATAPDFFYTRLKARMEKGVEPFVMRKRVLYPAYALATVIIVMLVNAAILFTKNNDAASDITLNSESENLQSIAAEYSINDVNSIYDLNEER